MTQNKMLIGSLSNDLNRVASLSYRGSTRGSEKFWESSCRWIDQLKSYDNKPHITKIINDLKTTTFDAHDKAQAEKNLMYSIILQNYTLTID